MEFISVTQQQGVDDGHKRMDKKNSQQLIEQLQKHMETMVKYECPHHGSFEANFEKCNECKKV
jgi:hypothetical protein